MICLPDNLMLTDYVLYGQSTRKVIYFFIPITHSPAFYEAQIKPHELLKTPQCTKRRLHDRIRYYNFRIKYFFTSHTFNEAQNLKKHILQILHSYCLLHSCIHKVWQKLNKTQSLSCTSPHHIQTKQLFSYFLF